MEREAYTALAHELREADPLEVPRIYRERAREPLAEIGGTVFKRADRKADRLDEARFDWTRERLAKELRKLLLGAFEQKGATR